MNFNNPLLALAVAMSLMAGQASAYEPPGSSTLDNDPRLTKIVHMALDATAKMRAEMEELDASADALDQVDLAVGWIESYEESMAKGNDAEQLDRVLNISQALSVISQEADQLFQRKQGEYCSWSVSSGSLIDHRHSFTAKPGTTVQDATKYCRSYRLGWRADR